MMIDLNSILSSVVVLILTIVSGFITKYINQLSKKINRTENEKVASQALLEGVVKAENELVIKAKKAASDGKLTDRKSVV